MRKISKNNTPQALAVWINNNPNKNYRSLDRETRRAIRTSLLEEQYFLCALCCQAIRDIDSCHNEHIESQNTNPARTLDYSNLVASCNTKSQCGDAHKSQYLPLTPFMEECETELRFKISGRIEGLTERGKKTISVLNLGDQEKNNKSLIEKRKQLSHALLFTNGINPSDGLDDDELVQSVIDDISNPKNGKLDPFSPVVARILKDWLTP